MEAPLEQPGKVRQLIRGVFAEVDDAAAPDSHRLEVDFNVEFLTFEALPQLSIVFTHRTIIVESIFISFLRRVCIRS